MNSVLDKREPSVACFFLSPLFLRAEENGYNEYLICPAETSLVDEYRSPVIPSTLHEIVTLVYSELVGTLDS